MQWKIYCKSYRFIYINLLILCFDFTELKHKFFYMKSISTIEQPILFFQNYFDLENVTKIRDSLFKGLIDKENYLFCVENYKIINVDVSDDSIEYFSDCIPVEIDPEIPPILTSGKITVSVNDILTENVKPQIKESKKLISKGIMESNDAKEYLNFILNELEGLYSKSQKNFAGRYPIIDDSLQDLITFIKTKQGVQTKTNIVNLPQDKDNNKSEKQKIVDDIFSCLVNYDYVSVSEYNRFIGYLYEFVEDYIVPTISPKFHHFKDKNKKLADTVLFYLFYKLFLTLHFKYNIRGYKRSFGAFLVEAFIHLNKKDIDKLTNKLSTNRKMEEETIPSYFPEC